MNLSKGEKIFIGIFIAIVLLWLYAVVIGNRVTAYAAELPPAPPAIAEPSPFADNTDVVNMLSRIYWRLFSIESRQLGMYNQQFSFIYEYIMTHWSHIDYYFWQLSQDFERIVQNVENIGPHFENIRIHILWLIALSAFTIGFLLAILFAVIWGRAT